jgi:predicted permease
VQGFDYSQILNAIVPVYLTMLVGAMARRFRVLPQEADNGLMRLSVNLLFPCLIVERLVGNPEVMNPGRVLAAAALGYGLVALGIGVSYAIGPLIGLKVGEGRRTFAISTGMQNYGFVAIPVISSLFPGKETLGVMFTFTLGVELAVWTLSVGLLTGLSKMSFRAVLNVPVISIVTALILNFVGAAQIIPLPVHSVLNSLGNCSIPLSVVLIGASIYDIWGQERLQWPVAIMSPILRLVVLPLTFLLPAWLLPLSLDMKRVLVIQGAMPAAVFCIVLARHYGGHAATAVQVVLATTVVSLVTTPVVIAFGVKWLHLAP